MEKLHVHYFWKLKAEVYVIIVLPTAIKSSTTPRGFLQTKLRLAPAEWAD